jgi:hypothetical protein
MKTQRIFFSLMCILALAICGCASVDVTKTGKGYYEPTNPNDVEILMTKPETPFVELGTVSVNGFEPSQTAKMHNAVRDKAAGLGANAVILLNSGIILDGWGNQILWATGVAIRYKDK